MVGLGVLGNPPDVPRDSIALEIMQVAGRDHRPPQIKELSSHGYTQRYTWGHPARPLSSFTYNAKSRSSGAGGEDRTPDLRFTKPLHYRCATPARVTLAISRRAVAQPEGRDDLLRPASMARAADQALEALVGGVEAVGDPATDALADGIAGVEADCLLLIAARLDRRPGHHSGDDEDHDETVDDEPSLPAEPEAPSALKGPGPARAADCQSPGRPAPCGRGTALPRGRRACGRTRRGGAGWLDMAGSEGSVRRRIDRAAGVF